MTVKLNLIWVLFIWVTITSSFTFGQNSNLYSGVSSEVLCSMWESPSTNPNGFRLLFDERKKRGVECDPSKNIKEQVLNGYGSKKYGDITITGNFINGLPNGLMEYLYPDGRKDFYQVVDGKIVEDADDITCRKYGFKFQTVDYAKCRQQIDLASQQAQQQQAQYEEQKRQYEAKVAEIQKEKDRKNALRQAEFFLRWGSGENVTDAARGAVGLPPMPKPPAPQTIFLPGGKAVICTTTGNTTSCF